MALVHIANLRGKDGLPGVNAVEQDEALAVYLADPLSQSGSQLRTEVSNVAPRWVFIGDDLDVARPVGEGPVEWITTIPGTIPTNAVAGDKVTEVDAVMAPITVWADDFSGSGALGTTISGGRAWLVNGAGYVAERTSGRLRFTAATSGFGVAWVDAAARVGSSAEVTFEATIPVQGVDSLAQIMFNFESVSNHMALARTSSSNSAYRLVRRLSNAAATFDTPGAVWPVMADGDRIRITINSDTGFTSISINSVLCWEGVIAEFLSSVGNFGLSCGSSGAFDQMRFDDAVMTLRTV